jgi:hypothetical protein
VVNNPIALTAKTLFDEFLLEHSMFSRRLDFFRFKQGRGQSMSDAMNELQRLGDQSDLGGLNPIDLDVMRYLTILMPLEVKANIIFLFWNAKKMPINTGFEGRFVEYGFCGDVIRAALTLSA